MVNNIKIQKSLSRQQALYRIQAFLYITLKITTTVQVIYISYFSYLYNTAIISLPLNTQCDSIQKQVRRVIRYRFNWNTCHYKIKHLILVSTFFSKDIFIFNNVSNNTYLMYST